MKMKRVLAPSTCHQGKRQIWSTDEIVKNNANKFYYGCHRLKSFYTSLTNVAVKLLSTTGFKLGFST